MSEIAERALDLTERECGSIDRQRPVADTVALMNRRIYFNSGGPNAKFAAAFFEKARRDGAFVVLARFPNMQIAPPEPAPRPAEDAIMPSAHAELTPADYGAERSCDFNHLNDRGREAYSEWLVGALTTFLQERLD